MFLNTAATAWGLTAAVCTHTHIIKHTHTHTRTHLHTHTHISYPTHSLTSCPLAPVAMVTCRCRACARGTRPSTTLLTSTASPVQGSASTSSSRQPCSSHHRPTCSSASGRGSPATSTTSRYSKH